MVGIRTLVPAVVLIALAAEPGSARADIIAATDFDVRTLTTTLVANDTATNLNWTRNGVDDPGSMAAKNAAGDDGLALFDSTATTKVIFAPWLNTGNGDTFWTTTVPLTVAAGWTVTLTDVTFDYWAINSSQVLNVPRRSDFTLTLYDPSMTVVDSVDIIDAMSGTTSSPQVPGLTATFTAPIALSTPGTYTLQIKGGDYLGTNETGNHTAIDNLSINGTAIPEPGTLWLLGLFGLAVLARRFRLSITA